jgi:flavin prenyltransferase
LTGSLSAARVAVAVTGASGACYAERLIYWLTDKVARVYLIYSDAGSQVIRHELSKSDSDFSLCRFIDETINTDKESTIRLCRNDDLFSPLASGSSAPTHMIVIPCSMGTLSRIAAGSSQNLIERCADVMLKQNKPLILVPREMPLNKIHLRNMMAIADSGGIIIPPCPAFYHNPKSLADLVDFVVGRVLELCDFEHDLYRKWNSRMI